MSHFVLFCVMTVIKKTSCIKFIAFEDKMAHLFFLQKETLLGSSTDVLHDEFVNIEDRYLLRESICNE